MEQEKLKELREAKCTVADCDKKQDFYQEMGFGLVMPFCMEHFMKMQELKHLWDKSARLVERDLQKNTGETVIIKNYKEWKEKVKQHFQDITTQGLVLTKGVCIYCGKKAIGCKTNFTPVCEEHTGFPLRVLKIAIKEVRNSSQP